MKKLITKIDMFSYNHPRFGIPNLMMFIVGANILLWLISGMDTTNSVANLLAFNPKLIMQGQVWRLVSFVLLPAYGSLFTVVIRLYFYYFIGTTLENQWGTPKFNIYVFSGIFFSVLYGMAAYWITGKIVSVSAEFVYFSMFFAFATMYPENTVLLFFIIPLKMKWLAIIDALFFLYQIFALPFPSNLLPLVAVLNYLIFCGGWLFDYLRPATVKQQAKTINFKREMRNINREQNAAPYNRKCAVCGKTDTDYPNMQFRFCSQCEGYHCFCEEHISNHVHFKE